jgi:hypothetical protein
MATASRWVRVTSYWNVAQADLAQMLLAAEGVPVHLENAAFLSWCWHYANAAGGVKVCVPDGDIQRAQGVLWSCRETASVTESPWPCPKCGAAVDSAWNICWHCGTSKNGEEDAGFWEPPALGSRLWQCSERAMATIVGLSGPFVFLLSRGSLPALLVWVVAVVWLRMLQNWPAADAGHEGPGIAEPSPVVETIEETAEVPTSEDYAKLEDTILRAWQAAVLSLWFPPLVFYSLWLLWKLPLPAEPLRPREQRRYLGAWAFNALMVALATFPLWSALVFRRF